MIPLSLLLVLASLGLLVTGLVESSQPLVWSSLIASLGACGCLVGSVLIRRRTTVTESAPTDTAARGPADGPRGQMIDLGSPAPDPAMPVPAPLVDGSPWAPPQPTVNAPAPGAPVPGESDRQAPAPQPTTAAAPAPYRPPADGTGPAPATDFSDATAAAAATDGDAPDEPGTEDIPVADALRVAQFADEVLVVDGHPRYHLAGCPYAADRSTVPLPLSSARRAGFTPCAICLPDATLLARHRAASRPTQ